ncbi:NAD(P)/FAD-dependent oxidoreductase [Poseidonocella sp. HB161398]|uniref:NAD(P)/FAD-dependent oxidoreductase n=1 Tax=Poseidonocella sp. HB161398 TaxID=2320855 RepID=UPI001108633D|nr:FAD-dependent oxidoreductase [Poseidonocella sp. HB161398]
MSAPGMAIIGAGEAGVRAAFALREQGYGGPVRLYSEEESLPYERPPLSKTDGAARPIMPGEAYAGQGIELRLGTKVEGIDLDGRALETSAGSERYDRLLIATGAEARRLAGCPEALYLRRDSDAARILPRLEPGLRLAVIGAGLIGLELAATARAKGAEVTVIETAPRILGRAVLPELAQLLAERHAAEGVRLVTGQGAVPVPGGLRLEDGGMVAADMIVAGIGAAPRTDLAEAAGLEVADGILVDAGHRSSAEHVFAAGDCCAIRQDGRSLRLESWRMARDQGERAAAAMLGAAAMAAPLPYFWSDQYDLCLQVAGLPDPAAPSVARTLPGGRLLFQTAPDGRLASVSGLGTGTALSKDIKLAERLILRGARPAPEALADPAQSLKRL